MFHRIDLATAGDLGPEPLPAWLDGLGATDAQLADLAWAGHEGVGYWPVVAAEPAFDPATHRLGGMTVAAPDLNTMTVPATYAVEPLPPPPVPNVISDRQFAQALAMMGVVTQEEALAWASAGTLPAALDNAIDNLPEAHRFPARMMLSAATTYERDHPMVPMIGALMGMGDELLDAAWQLGSEL